MNVRHSVLIPESWHLADPNSVTLLFEHPSGGKLYQSGYQAVPEDPSELGISLIVAATTKYRRQEKHENVIITLFKDKIGMPEWRWNQIEDMIVPAVRLMVATLSSGKGVLSVCRAGINRSSLLSGLTLNAASGLTPQEVVALIRERRGIECLFNEDFRNVVLYGF
jgi:protein-tyrosine phosphatase